jgi:hypothetical protein
LDAAVATELVVRVMGVGDKAVAEQPAMASDVIAQ